MTNLMTMKRTATIRQQEDGRFVLKAMSGNLFCFAYVYETRSKAEAAALKHRVILVQA